MLEITVYRRAEALYGAVLARVNEKKTELAKLKELQALSASVADQMADVTAAAAGRSDSAPAALAALYHFLDRPSVDRLRQVLGLRRAPEFEDWLERMGLADAHGRMLPASAQQPLLQQARRLLEHA